MKLLSLNEKQTYSIGETLAKNIHPGDIITIDGDLGAGKTVLVKGIANGLKIRANVNSPTFIIMRVYPVKQNKTIKKFCHVDAYRILEKTDADELGIQEYLDDKKVITVIEWPKNIRNILRPYKDRIIKVRIRMSKRDVETRYVEIVKSI